MFCSTINHIFFVSLLASCQPIEIYNRLQNLITYVKNHKESQNPNLMLGLYICEAQLLTIKSDPLDIYRPPMELLEDIKNLREQYEREAHRKPIWQSYTYSSIVVQQLLNLSFWVKSFEINDTFIFYGNLTKNHPTPSLTHENFPDIIDTGSPSPNQSDECLAELLNTRPLCTMSSHCIKIMSPNNESHGYHLTHKLLYYMVLRFGNCTKSLSPGSMSVDITIHGLCSLIWYERNLIVEMSIPNALMDLFLEQTLLCGLSGYIAFINENVVSEILQWQLMESGCYAYYDGSLDLIRGNESRKITTKKQKQKRDVEQLDGNCSDHMSGLAAAAFGLFVKITYFLNKNDSSLDSV